MNSNILKTDLEYVYKLILDSEETYSQLKSKMYRYSHDYKYTLRTLESQSIKGFAMLHGKYPTGLDGYEWNTDALTYNLYQYISLDKGHNVSDNLAELGVEIKPRKMTVSEATRLMANFAKDKDNRETHNLKDARDDREDIINSIKDGMDVNDVFNKYKIV